MSNRRGRPTLYAVACLLGLVATVMFGVGGPSRPAEAATSLGVWQPGQASLTTAEAASPELLQNPKSIVCTPDMTKSITVSGTTFPITGCGFQYGGHWQLNGWVDGMYGVGPSPGSGPILTNTGEWVLYHCAGYPNGGCALSGARVDYAAEEYVQGAGGTSLVLHFAQNGPLVATGGGEPILFNPATVSFAKGSAGELLGVGKTYGGRLVRFDLANQSPVLAFGAWIPYGIGQSDLVYLALSPGGRYVAMGNYEEGTTLGVWDLGACGPSSGDGSTIPDGCTFLQLGTLIGDASKVAPAPVLTFEDESTIRFVTDASKVVPGASGWTWFVLASFAAPDGTPPPAYNVSVTATPPTNEVGSHVVLLARLTPIEPAASLDVLVRFHVVSGPDADSFAALSRTDSTGTAGAVLGGKAAGTDVVEAWVDTDSNGLRDAGEAFGLASVVWRLAGPSYVAFGDSITTGESIKTCNPDDRMTSSKYKCRGTPSGGAPPATPYPESVAHEQNLDLDRVGIWGYTLQRATDIYPQAAEGSFPSQLSEIDRARTLVTGALGINDMKFSDPVGWLWQFRTKQAKSHAQDLIRNLRGNFDELFSVLKAAHDRGVTVVVTLYYNPYDNQVGCSTTYGIADLITGALNRELKSRAESNGLLVADFTTAFAGHGANSKDSYVWGSQCDLSGLIGAAFPDWDQSEADGAQGVKERFDPHPNNNGTAAMASAIEAVLR